jgi:two-component system chemotaxis response regulator CheB
VNEYPIVALSCSAGGLDALIKVLGPLPADLPAAILVLQHMPPDVSSQLPVVLGRSTDLAVEWAEDGASLRPGCVLVAPAGRHTLITKDETVALIPSGSVPPYRPSADLLLTSLALAAGRRVVAVVLSGEGQDAATGATAVHRFGGIVIVSSPETSARSAMPRATMIRDDITDHVVPLDDLAGLLLALTTAPVIEPGNGGRPSPPALQPDGEL